MQEVAAARALVERALDRLERQPADHPLKRIDPVKLRRLLAEAAFRELRDFRREAASDD